MKKFQIHAMSTPHVSTNSVCILYTHTNSFTNLVKKAKQKTEAVSEHTNLQ